MDAFPSWLAMSANVSVGCTPQTTDIFVCRRHVGNVVPTCRRHSVKSANFSAVGVVSVRPVADTHSYMHVGIGTNEVVTTPTKIRKSGMFTIARLIYSLSDFAASQAPQSTMGADSAREGTTDAVSSSGGAGLASS